MKIILLCGYFEDKYQKEINEKTKTWVENAANIFAKRILEGLLSQKKTLTCISAPLIGPWPTSYKDIVFKHFSAGETEENIQYVSFVNIWGYRNISRTYSLKRKIKKVLNNFDDEKVLIVVDGAHTPFLEAAVYAKSIKKDVHIHLIVPDLPQYMNLSKKSHPIYDFFKSIDIKRINRLNVQVDSFTLLTKHMAEILDVGERPFQVVEGITSSNDSKKYITSNKRCNTLAYAGKLEESFGVKKLIDAFKMIDDDSKELVVCGGGELKEYILEAANVDSRIHYLGIVPAEEAFELLSKSAVLVNPRQNNMEFTKYSFPSKNIEYISTGNAVVAYMLDGVPEIYRDFFYVPQDDSIEALRDAIIDAFSLGEVRNKKIQDGLTYIQQNLTPSMIAKRIIEISN